MNVDGFEYRIYTSDSEFRLFIRPDIPDIFSGVFYVRPLLSPYQVY